MDPIAQTIDYGRPLRPRRHSAVLLLLISAIMGCLFAFVCLFVYVLSLHIADNSYELSMVFDVQILGLDLFVGFASGALVFIPYYFVARSKPLLASTAILAISVIGELAVATPLNNRIAFVGSFVAFAVGLVAIRIFLPDLPPKPVSST